MMWDNFCTWNLLLIGFATFLICNISKTVILASSISEIEIVVFQKSIIASKIVNMVMKLSLEVLMNTIAILALHTVCYTRLNFQFTLWSQFWETVLTAILSYDVLDIDLKLFEIFCMFFLRIATIYSSYQLLNVNVQCYCTMSEFVFW